LSVRVCYVDRSDRGSSLRGLRLVGQASEDSWPGETGVPSEGVSEGAAWIKQRLAGTRDTTSLALLCLDVEGGICSWLTSPSDNPALIATLARQGGAMAESRAGAAVEFYAPDGLSSSVQALNARPETNGSFSLLRRAADRRAQGAQEAQRLAVLAMADVPARLLVDALDREGVPVDAVASLWHVMAASWDPAAPRPGAAPADSTLLGQTASLTAVVLADPQSSRLAWSWSRSGKLVVAGSMRLRQAVPETAALAQPDESAHPILQYGPEEVSRLTTEWLTWAAQLGQAPSRFVCILPEGDQSADLGRALGKAWPGAAVDVVTSQDPVGATLHRAADLLENTPVGAGESDAGAGMVDLSRRPGTQHRRMYVWWSAAIAAAALGMMLLGLQLRSAAAKSQNAATRWHDLASAAVTQVLPDAKDLPGKSKLQTFKEAVDKAERSATAPKRTEEAVPVLEELETISLVVGNNGYSIETIDLDSKGLPRFTVIANTTRDAEDLLDALKRVSGSRVTEWAGSYSPKKEGDQDKVRATFSGRWVLAKGGTR
jgi:hypothetical protein